jgi:superfamily II DNA/RNA helicase
MQILPHHHHQPIIISKASSVRTTHLSASHATISADISSKEKLQDLTIAELKELLRTNNEKVSGNKAELVDRILSHQQSSSAGKDVLKEDASEISYHPSLSQLPKPVLESFLRFSSSSNAARNMNVHDDGADASASPTQQPKLLPIQERSFDIIADGGDAVIFSPTGTGKTLAYILPLAKRLFEWKHDGSLQHRKKIQKQRFIQQQRNKNDSMPSKQTEAAAPSILVIEPSRELAKQVGKVWSKFHPTVTKATKQIVTVFGGVPTARQAALLSSKTDVVVGTPGRIRELIREGFLSTSHVRSIVLDEGDVLLNFQDNPEVEWLLEGMRNDYQLILASATINKRVETFVGEVMELEVGEEGYVNMVDVVDEDATSNDYGIETNDIDFEIEGTDEQSTQEVVNHWAMAASARDRTALVSDLIITSAPRRGIIFVPSKAEVEVVAQELIERLSSANDVSIHVLHGDMVQAARSRTIVAFRGDTETAPTQTNMSRILVATDVASRGLDIPTVDLVLQYGVPRKNGKDGTFDSELFIHRTGRAGRFGSTRTADTIILYDRSQGEGTTLKGLQDEMIRLRGVEILPKTLPSPGEVMNAAYHRALQRFEKFDKEGEDNREKQDLVQYFEKRLMKDILFEHSDSGPSQTESLLMTRLAAAMAALSGLEDVVPPRSLLTANPSDRTIRVWSDSCSRRNPLSPPEVTKVVKELGSGKLGRISICEDGSAVFDLSQSKAKRLLQKAGDKEMSSLVEGWHFEMPESLSAIPS